MRRFVPCALSLLAFGGCYDAHRPEGRVDARGCHESARPTCAAQVGDACSAWGFVEPVCDEGWACPAGSVTLTDAPPADGSCAPLRGGAMERGAMERVATFAGGVDDGAGACAWIAQSGWAGGREIAHPAALVRPGFGACVEGEWEGGDRPISVLEEEEPDRLTSVLEAATYDDAPLLAVRHYRWAPGGGWPGVEATATGFARWDPAARQLRLEAPTFGPEVDVGDALVADGDALYGLACPHPSGDVILHLDCYLARLDGDDPVVGASWSFRAGGGWVTSIDEADRVFRSGPERSSIRWIDGLDAWAHVYVAGFGDRVMLRTARALDGAWSDARTLVECELPPDDPEAFCGSPLLRVELIDPRRPDQLAITYDVSTLSEDREALERDHPDAYWPRLVRVTP